MAIDNYCDEKSYLHIYTLYRHHHACKGANTECSVSHRGTIWF